MKGRPQAEPYSSAARLSKIRQVSVCSMRIWLKEEGLKRTGNGRTRTSLPTGCDSSPVTTQKPRLLLTGCSATIALQQGSVLQVTRCLGS
jgi:hypothetical protein